MRDLQQAQKRNSYLFTAKRENEEFLGEWGIFIPNSLRILYIDSF